jgi:CRISPR-associated endoribonuclease Cas6
MKIQLKLEMSGKQIFPLNYQHPLSSWIYKILDQGDEEFAKFLHDTGYKLENKKTFKLFTFSGVRFPKHTKELHHKYKDRLVVTANTAYVDICFYLPEQMQPFIAGIFKGRDIEIGDPYSVFRAKVTQVEMAKAPEFTDGQKVLMHTKTPVFMAKYYENKKHPNYILPIDPDYIPFIKKNLIDKCAVVNQGHIKEDDIEIEITTIDTKHSLQTFNQGKKSETQMKGYSYDFTIQAPKIVLDLVLSVGIGSQNSMGFGMCEVKGGV